MTGTFPTDTAPPNEATLLVPDVIPIFPLPGTVLLPGEVLPLRVFEPRYRAMVKDSLDGHRVIGVVAYRPDPVALSDERPPVERVGCLGLIAQHQELADGEYLMWLLGLERFSIDEEVLTDTLYRQVRVTYTPDEESADVLAGIHPLSTEMKMLLPSVLESDDATRRELAGQLDDVSDSQLIALGAQILGLDADRKQVLLESRSQMERFTLLWEDLFRRLEEEDLSIDASQLN